MSNADILIEMIRLGEQFGNVTEVNLYKSGYCHIEGKTKAGKGFSLSLSIKEENKDGN